MSPPGLTSCKSGLSPDVYTPDGLMTLQKKNIAVMDGHYRLDLLDDS